MLFFSNLGIGLRVSLAAILMAACGVARAQVAEPVFTIGVLPNVSARVILANYQPMRAYFERELKRKVEIATAPDFRAFSAATLRGDYHVVVTAANVGRVTQLDGKWEPLAIYEPPIPGLLVAGADNTDASPDQLKGKSLALANPQSLVALRGLQWLREQGLQSGRDFKTVLGGNDDSLGTLIRSGEAPMAIMSMGEFRAISEDTRKSLKIVTEFAKVPGFWVMANPRLATAERQQLKTLLLQFPQTDDGKKFTSLSGVANLRDLPAAEQALLDAFVEQTRAGLGGGK